MFTSAEPRAHTYIKTVCSFIMLRAKTEYMNQSKNMPGIQKDPSYWGTTEKPEIDLKSLSERISVSHSSPSSDIAAKYHPTDWPSMTVHEHQLADGFSHSDLDPQTSVKFYISKIEWIKP